jgi:hypothetical protein
VIKWPCIVKFFGEDELLYLANNKALYSDCKDCILNDDDYLIDINGNCYSLLQVLYSKEVTEPLMKIITLDEITQLIRLSEFSKASLCLSKIHFQNIAQAIQSLAMEVS